MHPGHSAYSLSGGAHQLDLIVAFEAFDKRRALRVAHCNADVSPLGGQAFHDSATEESRSSEYGYTFGRHQVSPPMYRNITRTRLPILIVVTRAKLGPTMVFKEPNEVVASNELI